MTDIQKAMLGNREAAKRLTDAEVLLPCPFCGGKGAIENDRCDAPCWLVYCVDCGVYPELCWTEQEARLAWNTRAPILSESEMEMLDAKD